MANSNFQYTILSGDTLSKIANEINASAGVNAQQIAQANPGIDPAGLKIGEVINIPATIGRDGLRYTVRSGGNYMSIAQAINAAAGLTCQQIEQANPDINPNKIFVGQVISIPVGELEAHSSNTESPSNTDGPTVDAEHIGYWHWTYHNSYDPPGTTMGMAFFGAVDPAEAIQQSAKVKDRLKGEKYICLGGGTSSGSYQAAAIAKIINAIKAGDFAGYQGIAYDIEVGGSGFEDEFKQLFAVSKANGFKVLVTISHSRPYGIKDGNTLMDQFFADENIDFLSPQLYTTGKESANDYTAYGIKWSDYASARAAVIPSIVKAGYYDDAVKYFKNQGVDLKGYVQWSQN